MKKILNLSSLAAVVCLSAFSIGCGSDDGGGAVGGGQGQFAPTTADFTTRGGSLTLHQSQPAGAPARQVVFSPNGNFTVDGQGLGTFTYEGTSPNTGMMVLTYPDANITETYTVTWTSNADGTYTYRAVNNATGAIEEGTGSFTSFALAQGGGPGPGPDPNPDPGPGNGTTPPALLTGQRILLTTTGAGTETLTFTSPTAFGSDIGATGSYTYSLVGNAANLVMQYQSPETNAQDVYTLTLNFDTPTEGTWTGNLFYNNLDHFESGTFTVAGP
jgi:hypothetical protein